MKEELVQIKTKDGLMETFVTYPEQDGPFPPVIIYMDIWGWREELFDIARRVATVGYYCILPDLYYRQGKVRFEFRNELGQMRSLEELDDATKEMIRVPMRQLTDAMAVEDTASILEFIKGQPVKDGPIGSVGYCMGGRHVLRMAGHYPDRFTASASLHGTRLMTDAPDSAHRLSDRFRGEMYCGFAEVDPYAPMSMIVGLADLLKDQKNVRYRYEVHKGTIHGYSLPDRDIFHKPSANRDWELIFAMFSRQIPPYRD
jgi:carboxymethylenebutenolidase